MLLLAHRGASADAPENTLQAFQEAMRQGADGVELDVQRCATGEVVVCHDERLSRVAGLDWEVKGTSWSKLKAATAIPLLEDVLTALPKDKLVNVELKCETLADGGLTAAVVKAFRRTGEADRIVVSSFNPVCLWRMAALFPSVRRGYLIDPERSFAVEAGVFARLSASFSVHPPWAACSAARLQRWRSRGFKVAAWTVDSPERALTLRAWGLDYLITNVPGAMRKALEGA